MMAGHIAAVAADRTGGLLRRLPSYGRPWADPPANTPTGVCSYHQQSESVAVPNATRVVLLVLTLWPAGWPRADSSCRYIKSISLMAIFLILSRHWALACTGNSVVSLRAAPWQLKRHDIEGFSKPTLLPMQSCFQAAEVHVLRTSTARASAGRSGLSARSTPHEYAKTQCVHANKLQVLIYGTQGQHVDVRTITCHHGEPAVVHTDYCWWHLPKYAVAHWS